MEVFGGSGVERKISYDSGKGNWPSKNEPGVGKTFCHLKTLYADMYTLYIKHCLYVCHNIHRYTTSIYMIP